MNKPFAALPAALVLALSHVAWAVPVQVQVLGAGQKPVPNAPVRVRFFSLSDVLQQGEPMGATTDARGVATLEAPDEGADGPDALGYATVWSPGLVVDSVALYAGLNEVTLGTSGVARGLVVDEAGQPVANARVRIASLNRDLYNSFIGRPLSFHSVTDAAISEARTDAQGRWSIGLAPLGSQLLVELVEDRFVRAAASTRAAAMDAPFDWAPLQASVRSAVQAPAVVPESMSANLGAQKFNEDGILVARPGASITGRVLDPKGAPVAGVSVMAGSEENRFSRASFAKTDEKGEFRLDRLLAGGYALSPILLGTPKIEWAPGTEVKVKVAGGVVTAAPEMKMIQGGAIQVRLLDEATGKGVAGASVSSHGGTDDIAGWLSPQRTDAEGRATLHVPPGKRAVMMSTPPSDYLVPEHSSYQDPTEVEVGLGENKSVQWKLKKGLSATGRFVDEKGHPVPNVSVSFLSITNRWGPSKTARSDATGKWSVGGLDPGGWKPSAEGVDWRVVSPTQISLPLQATQEIVLAPVARYAVGGRVVDGEGKPLAGVQIGLKIKAAQGIIGSQFGRVATTGADGTWSVTDVPEIAYEVAIQAKRAGYAVDRAPRAAWADRRWTVSEAVLIPRDARLGGQILLANGQPAANAQVLVASSRAVANADAEGRWALAELPRGESEVIAVAGADVGVVTVGAPNGALLLRLKAPQVLVERDVDAAQAILEDAWETSRGSKYVARETLPAILATSDPDAALALAGGADKKPSSAAIYQIVRVLARAGDFDALQSWTRGHLDALDDPYDRERALFLVAESLAGKDDAGAKAWMALARASYAALKEDAQLRTSAQHLAVLAARLKEADAEALFEQALALAKAKGAGGRPDGLYALALAVAPVSEAWAEKIIQAALALPIPKTGARPKPDLSIGSAVLGMARVNLPGARRLLAKYGGTKSDEYNSVIIRQARVQVLGQRARAGEDVDPLVKEAGTDLWAARTIALIAQSAPKERQAELLGRALELAQSEEKIRLESTLRIVSRLLPVDRAAAKAALDKIRASLEAPRDTQATGDVDEDTRLRGEDGAGWAWLYRQFDPTAARLLIEREWALGVALPPSRDGGFAFWSEMVQLVVAMMPLDIARAQQMAERLPITAEGAPAFEAQAAIARWMMASSQERASKPIEFWSRDLDALDRRSLNEW